MEEEKKEKGEKVKTIKMIVFLFVLFSFASLVHSAQINLTITSPTNNSYNYWFNPITLSYTIANDTRINESTCFYSFDNNVISSTPAFTYDTELNPTKNISIPRTYDWNQTGVSGSSLTFNRTDSYPAQSLNQIALSAPTMNFTVYVLYKDLPSGGGNNYIPFATSNNNGSGDYIQLRYEATGNYRLRYNIGGVNRDATYTTTPNLQQWYKIRGVYDGLLVRLLIDDVEVATGVAVAGSFSGTRNVVLGGSHLALADPDAHNGGVDELTIDSFGTWKMDNAIPLFSCGTPANSTTIQYPSNITLGWHNLTLTLNDTSARQFNFSASVFTDSLYEVRATINSNPVNFTVNYTVNTVTTQFVSANNVLWFNYSNSPRANNVNVTIDSPLGINTFNQSFNTITYVYNTTYTLSPRTIFIYFKNEDTNDFTLGSINLTIFQLNGSIIIANYTYFDLINSTTITPPPFTGLSQFQADYLGARRNLYPVISKTDNTNVTIFFPSVGNGVIVTWTTTSGGLVATDVLVSLYRLISGTYQVVSQGLTDATGKTQTLLSASTQHRIIVTKTGCTTIDNTYTSLSSDTSESIALGCLGTSNISQFLTQTSLNIYWNPNETYTNRGVLVSVSDSNLLASYIYFNVTKFNYTGTSNVYFQNVSSYQAVFTYGTLLKNNIYNMKVCVQYNGTDYCAEHIYINQTGFTGIGNWTVQDFEDAGGFSVTTMTLIFFLVLSVILVFAYQFMGDNAVFVLLIGVMVGVVYGFLSISIGLLIALIAVGVIAMTRWR